jgi:hypothetical protein
MSQPPAGDPAAIEAEIEARREHLASTIDEIAARLDVRTPAQERALRTRDTVVETYRESPPAVVGAALVLVGLVVTVVVRRRRRRAVSHRGRGSR